MRDGRDENGKRLSIHAQRLIKSRMKWEWNVGFGNCTESWRLARKLLDRSLRPADIAAYRPLLQTKSYALLSQVLANPEDLEAHLNRFVAFVCRARPPVFLSIVPTVQPVRIANLSHGVWL